MFRRAKRCVTLGDRAVAAPLQTRGRAVAGSTGSAGHGTSPVKRHRKRIHASAARSRILAEEHGTHWANSCAPLHQCQAAYIAGSGPIDVPRQMLDHDISEAVLQDIGGESGPVIAGNHVAGYHVPRSRFRPLAVLHIGQGGRFGGRSSGGHRTDGLHTFGFVRGQPRLHRA
jgi:hypothetical protein